MTVFPRVAVRAGSEPVGCVPGSPTQLAAFSPGYTASPQRQLGVQRATVLALPQILGGSQEAATRTCRAGW